MFRRQERNVTFWFGNRELRSRDLEKCVPISSCLVAPSSFIHTSISGEEHHSPGKAHTSRSGFYPLQPCCTATCAYLSFVPLWRSRPIPLKSMNIKMCKIRAETTSLCVTAPSTNKPGRLSYSAGSPKEKKVSSFSFCLISLGEALLVSARFCSHVTVKCQSWGCRGLPAPDAKQKPWLLFWLHAGHYHCLHPGTMDLFHHWRSEEEISAGMETNLQKVIRSPGARPGK